MQTYGKTLQKQTILRQIHRIKTECHATGAAGFQDYVAALRLLNELKSEDPCEACGGTGRKTDSTGLFPFPCKECRGSGDRRILES